MMRNKIGIVLMLVIFQACGKIDAPPDELIERHSWLDAMAVTDIRYLSHSGGTLNFELEVAAMKNGKFLYDYPDAAFHEVSGFALGSAIYIDSISRIEKSENPSYQTILIVDETSDDWIFVDDGNFNDAIFRLKKSGDEAQSQYCGFGYYARDEVNGDSPVHFFRNASTQSLFQHSEQEIMEFISENYVQLGKASSSSLFDAINKSIDELISNPLSSNKSITVVTAKFDDGNSSINASGIIQRCRDNNIKINVLMFNMASNSIYQMVGETGGFINDNTATSFGGVPYNGNRTALYHVHDLIRDTGKRYILKCRVVRASAWNSGQIFYGYLEANYYEEIESQYFDEDLNNDLDINLRLPVYIKIP